MYSELGEKIKYFFSVMYQRELKVEEIEGIEYAIENHILPEDEVPGWMLKFFDNITHKRELDKKIPYPNGYPFGENGLINILADLEMDHGFDFTGFNDYGEAVEWKIEKLGLKLFINREGEDYYLISEI